MHFGVGDDSDFGFYDDQDTDTEMCFKFEMRLINRNFAYCNVRAALSRNNTHLSVVTINQRRRRRCGLGRDYGGGAPLQRATGTASADC